MECPKCGFQQPQDDYCAQCGISIRLALSRRQRKNLLALLSTFVLIIAAALYLPHWLSRERTEPHPASTASQGKPVLQKTIPGPAEPGLTHGEFTEPSKPSGPEAEDLASPASEPTPAVPSPSLPASDTEPTPLPPPVTEPQTPKTPTEDTPLNPDPEQQIRRWAAQEWFEKGQELADYSEEELSFYQEALKVDPHFALAHYYMGLIHWEWGEEETAIASFRKFWRDATEEERAIYMLPEGISSEELGFPEKRR
jgi:tetratricopeptide (TPR) repeat protein